MGQLDGKVVMITGASQGIGREIALRMAEEGAGIVAIDIADQVADTAAAAEEKGVKAVAFKGDVTRLDEMTEIVGKAIDKLEKIDILVNNAGITRDNLILRMSEEAWDMVLAVNLKGIFNCTKAIARSMLKQRGGKIVNIASVIGVTGNAGQANYAASKGGVIALTKTAAREFASRGITVNAVAPGFIQTAMTEKLSDEAREASLAQVPLQSYGTPKDVADAVLFLAGPNSDYITGQVLHVDGGMVM